MVFKRPPVICSDIQGPIVATSEIVFSSNPLIVLPNPAWILPGKQSKSLCKFLIGLTKAFWAAIPARSAAEELLVAAKTTL